MSFILVSLLTLRAPLLPLSLTLTPLACRLPAVSSAINMPSGSYSSVPSKEDQVLMVDRESWRDWLRENHKNRRFIWLIFYKKSSSIQSIDYESAVLEALCFGWIDSKVQRIDDEKYRQYFCPRKPTGQWNGINKRRVCELEKQGLMTEAGRKSIRVAKQNGAWSFLDDVEAMVIPEDLEAAFGSEARENFDRFSNSKKKAILYWIKQAKRPTTRKSRVDQAADAAKLGKAPLSYI